MGFVGLINGIRFNIALAALSFLAFNLCSLTDLMYLLNGFGNHFPMVALSAL